MVTPRPPSAPLWLELLLLGGMIELANRLDSMAASNQEEGPHHHARKERSENRLKLELLALQRARARQKGRGREAKSPLEIPRLGWMDISWRVFNRINDDRLLAVAAGAAFYLLLAIFPAIGAFISLYGMFAQPSTIAQNLSALSIVMPQAGVDLIEEQVKTLTQASTGALSFGFFFGLGLALWSANAGMKGIIDALNVAYGEREKRSFLRLLAVSFAFTFGGMLFAVVALSAIVVAPLIFAWLGFESETAQLVAITRWPALFVAIMLWLAVLYRFAPSRREARWLWLSVGSAFATVGWLGGSWLFSWYLIHIANYSATYGSLGAAVGLMTWLWLSVLVILIGAELNAEIEHQTACDTTVGGEKPLGARGAVMADTVGPHWK